MYASQIKFSVQSHIFTSCLTDTRKLLAYLPTARDRLSTERFLQIASSALRHSTKHSSADFRQISQDVEHALDIVTKYFSSSDIDEVVRKITQEDAWNGLGWLLKACGDLAAATKDARLFDQDVVKALARCARQVPKGHGWENDMNTSMIKIYECSHLPAESYVGFVTIFNKMLTAHRIERSLDNEM